MSINHQSRRRFALLSGLCATLALIATSNVAAYPVTPEGEPLYADTGSALAVLTPDAGVPVESSTGTTDALPGDTGGQPFWPHETGVLVGTSETFADVRADGSYFDPSLGRRVSTPDASRREQSLVVLAAIGAAASVLLRNRRRVQLRPAH
jgi:hypothetical protein